MKKTLFRILIVIIGLYIALCGILYFSQEKLIFFPEHLDKNYKFEFDQKFEELNIKSTDGKYLNGLLFKADSSKGLIFYLHGNSGCINTYKKDIKTYTDLNYDVFIIDYRGYGKSEGRIKSQAQLFEDDQTSYNQLKKNYTEDKIIILGYSLGTGLASKLASTNHPKMLILQAPYYSFIYLMKQRYPLIPTFILKYKLTTNEYLKNCNMPVVIFHGDSDEVINYSSSLKLKEELKKQDTLITLNGQGHNNITDNKKYRIELKKILSK